MKKSVLFLFTFAALVFGGEMTWSGYKGGAVVPPQVTKLEGGRVIRVEAVADGAWQGALLKIPDTVCIRECKAMEFKFRHNLTKNKLGVVVRFEQKQGMVMTSAVAPTDDWNTIYVAFDQESFQADTGNAVSFGDTHEIRFSPYSAMNKTGLFMEFADLKFISKHGPAEAQADDVPIRFQAYKGAASVPAQVTTRETPEFGAVTRIEAVEKGVYQGAVATLNPPADLSKYTGLEFMLRHNLSKSKMGLDIRFEQKAGMVRGYAVVPSNDWNKVFLPFDVDSFQAAGGNAVVFALAHELRITPAGGMMDEQGEFLEFAAVRLVPRQTAAEGTTAEGPQALKVMNYKHNTPPSRGDDRAIALTDGDKAANVIWAAYKEEPDIEFDLGARYALDELKIEAFAAPSHNFDTITVFTSYDEKNWTPAGMMRNTDTGIEPIAMTCVWKPEHPVVGRYFRLKPSRPRSDFSVSMSEVSFRGHTPSEEEIAAAAEMNYDLGPAMPARESFAPSRSSQANYYPYIRGDWKLQASRKNGVINGVWYKDKLIIERLSAQYTLQTRAKDTDISGYDDKVQSIVEKDGKLVITVSNPKLPGLTIERAWWIDGAALVEKNTVIGAPKERNFLRLATTVILEQKFRQNGFYEMPSSALASAMFRLPATEVRMDRGMTNIPALMIENPVDNLTLMHVRHRFNDRFTYFDVGAEEETLQTFKANGWLLMAATIVPGDAGRNRQSVENRLFVTEGRMLQAYDEYIHLPEVKAYREPLVKSRPAWLRDLRTMWSLGWEGRYPKASKRVLTNYINGFSHRGILINPENENMDGLWGDWSPTGVARGLFGEKRDMADVAKEIQEYKAMDPRIKHGLYTWFWSAFPWSTPVKNHPEWFVTTLRNGAKASWFPGVNVNYLRFWGIKESREEAINQVFNFIKVLDQDDWYLDGGKCGVYAKDWAGMRIDDPLGQTDFYCGVRKAIQADRADRIVVFNQCMNPIGDVGYLESFGGTLTNEWRRGATLMWKFRMFAYQDPKHHSAYEYWLPQLDNAFCNYIAGIGVLGSYGSRYFDPHDLPFHGARYDIRQAQLTEADILPNWRFDWKEELEGMALRQQNNGWVFWHCHSAKPMTREVSVNLKGLGLADSAKPVYAWLYAVRDGATYGAKCEEPRLAKVYQNSGWISERGVAGEYLGVFPWRERFGTTLSIKPKEAKVLMLTQVPAGVLSIEGDPIHYFLAGQPGIELEEQNGAFLVNNEFKNAEIGLILPDGTVPEKVTVNGREMPFTLRIDRKLRLAVVGVGSGKSTIAMTTRQEKAPAVTQLGARVQDGKLVVEVSPATAQVSVYNEGILTLSRRGGFAVAIPDTARDGEYLIAAGDKTATVAIRGFGKKMALQPVYVALPEKKSIVPVNKTVRGIPVLQKAECYSEECGITETDANSLRLKAGALPYYESHFFGASAAFEIKAKRYVKVRVENGFAEHTRWDYEPQRHFVRRERADAFGGVILDFHTSEGYTVRSAAGFGQQTEKRKNGHCRPEFWGKKKSPDYVFVQNNAVYDGSQDVLEFWMDLKSLGAPKLWDGQLWFTVHIEHSCPDRYFAVTILETADDLPTGAEAQKVRELGAKQETSVDYTPAKIGSALNWTTVPVLAKLSPADAQAKPLETVTKVAYDDKNLYLRYECGEEADHIITCEGGTKGTPWVGDGVELMFQCKNDKAQALHLIVDAAGVMYQEYAPLKDIPGAQRKVLSKSGITCKPSGAHKGNWTMEVTVPWAVVGGKPGAGAFVSFNLMRNRIEQGQYSFYTLSANGDYLSGNQCRLKF